MNVKILSIAFSALFASSALAACRTPVGGSENSVGDGYYDLLARSAFEDSPASSGQRDLLVRHGFCRATAEPDLASIVSDCTGTDCPVQIRVSLTYESAELGTRVVAGVFTASASSGHSTNLFFANKIDLEGIGREVTLDDEQATLLMGAMQTVGITPPNPRVVGVYTLDAGSLRCSTPVVPRAIPTCRFAFRQDTLPVANVDQAIALEDMLLQLGANVGGRLVGARNTGVAQIECRRVVVPNAVASCSVVIEE